MGAVDTTYTFTATDTITSSKMNNIIDQTTITGDAIFGTTLEVASGKLKVRSQGITSNELAVDSVTTTVIKDGNVTTAKILNDNITTAKILDNNITTSKILDANVTFPKLNLPTNFPIQIKQSVKTDIQTITGSSSTWVDVSGLSVSLTRAIASASGKVRVQAIVSSASNDTNNSVALRIMRDGVVIDAATGNADGVRSRVTSNGGANGQYNYSNIIIDYIDSSPGSASSVTYKIQARLYSGATGYINRSGTDSNNADYGFRTISTVTVTELAP